MSQVFIYTEKAKIPRTHLTALRKAGIVPVRVSSFDQARFVQAEAPIEANDMLRAAVRVIAGCRIDNAQAAFVNELNELLGCPQ